MKHGLLLITLCIAATALTSGSALGIKPASTPSPTTTTHSPTPNTTTHSPTPNTTTHSPTPNTTTHSPSPNTTTHNPNSTTHNPNSTTPAPTTTPVPVPTSATNLTMGKYNVTGTNGICILLDMAAEIRVNNSQVNGTYIVQPSKTTASGECTPSVTIMLNFDEGDISFKFKKDDKKVYVEYVEYDLTYAFTSKVLSHFTGKNESLELFSVEQGRSYSCKAETVDMGNGVRLYLTQFRIQATEIKNNEFGPPDLCKADQPDYRVPIAVGVILIILIIIVVIAYLISRKRRNNGYQSL